MNKEMDYWMNDFANEMEEQNSGLDWNDED